MDMDQALELLRRARLAIPAWTTIAKDIDAALEPARCVHGVAAQERCPRCGPHNHPGNRSPLNTQFSAPEKSLKRIAGTEP